MSPQKLLWSRMMAVLSKTSMTEKITQAEIRPILKGITGDAHSSVVRPIQLNVG